MKITKAIRIADTEHVVYFLLGAYVETLEYYDPLRSLLPQQLRRLPMAGISDISERLLALCALVRQYADPTARLLLKEAVEIFSTALQRLRTLQNAHQIARPFLPLRGPTS